jgi:DNA (cytosine-5)-methyltransferase 1
VDVTSSSTYWRLVEDRRGRRDVSKGDTRALISALTDIIAVDSGIINSDGLESAFREALDRVLSVGLSRDILEQTLNEWRGIDRTPLQNVLGRSGRRIAILRPAEENGQNVVSLFTGSYGLDLGFEYAGFKVDVALDSDRASELVVTTNRPHMPFITQDIGDVSTSDILAEAGLARGEVDVLTGGPPCQPFSTAGKRAGLNDPRASPLKEFIRVIEEAQPQAFVMEEVTGLLNARIRHVPIAEREGGLPPDGALGGVWRLVLDELRKTHYHITWAVLNAADFGTPQVRRRVILIGLRRDLRIDPHMPAATHTVPGQSTLIGRAPWNSLLDALAGVTVGDYAGPSPKYARLMKCVPPGGNWRHIPVALIPEAMNGAYEAGGGKMGFYRRLSLFEPSPTLVTTPIMKGSMLIHPIEDRPLSVNEYKAIQGFPLDWEVPGAISTRYRKLGEAVPPLMSYAVALSVKQMLAHVERGRDYVSGAREGST